MSSARSFSGLAPTARWARTRNRSKSSAKTPTILRRAISFTTRRKSGAMTVSHLRFGPRPIRSTYLMTKRNFVGCHQPFLLETYDVLKDLAPGGTFLLNSPFRCERSGNIYRKTCSERMIDSGALLRHRREQSRARVRDGRPHQHGDADLLLRHLRRACRRRRRSLRSRIRSAKPMAKKAKKIVRDESCARSMKRSRICTK